MVDWIHQHVVQHHVNTNDVHNDPDIIGNVLLRLNPITPVFSHQAGQYFYTFLLLALFGFTVVEYSAQYVIRGFHHIPMSPLIKTYRLIDVRHYRFYISTSIVDILLLFPCLGILLHLFCASMVCSPAVPIRLNSHLPEHCSAFPRRRLLLGILLPHIAQLRWCCNVRQKQS